MKSTTTTTLSQTDIPLDDSWDVIIAGGGPAGCTAAAAAAREGARVLVLEATGCLGGMGTAGLVPAWCYFTDGERIIYRGLALRVLEEMVGAMPHLSMDDVSWPPIDPEKLKSVYDRLVAESGARVRFFTKVCHVATENGKITHVVTSSKAGLEAFGAKVFIDCTGDGDVAAWAGAPFEKGGDEGQLMPATHCFTLTNIDAYALAHQAGAQFHPKKEAIFDIVASGKYPDIIDAHACSLLVGPDAMGFNGGHICDVDATDPDSVSDAMVAGRKIAGAMRDALREFCPETFGNAWLAQTAPLMGIRESRRIMGDYVLTADDFMNRATFDDEIARNCYYIDIHQKPSPDNKSYHVKYGKGESHGIPYRCLVPRGLTNVLVAGRPISVDRIIHGSTRVMNNCLTTGEAAGIAAAMAAAQNADVRTDVDTGTLREKLRAHGAWLP